ncbi:MAG: heme lyase CcmF/NrfE family subunit [Oligoflexia bacterium]|nr:heme lyase CcmF/NrfE family subunit [Oligoflexia bacterium]
MAEFGHLALFFAWILALFGVLGGAGAGIKRSRKLLLAVVNSTKLVTLCCFLSIFALGWLFIHNDYSVQYVWRFSNRDMPDIYKISAIWGGMDGSMLLWAFILSLSSGVVALNFRASSSALMSWTLAVLNSSALFFLSVVMFITDPFRYIKAPFVPPDGNGLNPLLQNPLMVVHPPMLYLGFTTFAVPFAFCLGALFSGVLNNDWIRLTRRWTLLGWAFLTAGIVMGGHWAYVELGWGGFWAWDPVENSSFLPWLTGSAFLHSVMVQERKSMLKIWNVWLVVATYGLTVFGTFLTRSGIVQSVHAFAETDMGWVFLAYLGTLVALTLALTIWRRKELRPERRIESFFSREAAFLINNLILLSICFATLWGVMFPVISEAVTGVKQTVSIPFFNAVNVPLFLALIFMMGVGPLIAWRKSNLPNLRRTFLGPFVFGIAVAVLLVWAGVPGFYPILSYALCAFVLMTILGEMHRGIRAQALGSENALAGSLSGAGRLFRRHRDRYAGYLVHFGVLVATIGITASMAHKVEREFALAPGESFRVGRFELKLKQIDEGQTPNYQSVTAVTEVFDQEGNFLRTLKPEMRSYVRNQENTTEVALNVTLREDLYLVMVGLDDSGRKAALKVFINPLQVWLWFGAILMIIGSVIILLPRKQTAPAFERAPQGSASSSI